MKPEPGSNPFCSVKALLVSTHGDENQTAYMGSVHIPVVPDARCDRSDERAAASCSQKELMHYLTHILLDCGIPASLTGHSYVRKAILLEFAVVELEALQRAIQVFLFSGLLPGFKKGQNPL